jgi:polar amino acid transport system substrate-binding protein/arginine/ornithine transport system substrate-binding protein
MATGERSAADRSATDCSATDGGRPARALAAAILLAPLCFAVTAGPAAATGQPPGARPIPIDYADTLAGRPARLVAPEDAGFAASAEGLAERRLGVQRGTLHQCIAERLFPAARLRLYDSQDAGFAALAEGRVDALLADAIAAWRDFLGAERGRGFAFLGDELFDRACHDLGVAEGEPDAEPPLRERLDDALDALRDEGTLKALGDKYFKHDEPD